MNPWARVLLVLLVAVGGALLLRVVPPILVLGLFVGGVTYINHRVRRAVRKGPRTGAELLGLKRETEDPFGILGYPIALFARGSEPAIDELVWGTWNGLDVRVFAVSLVAPALPGHPPQRASFACALTRLDADLPAVVVEPGTFVTRIERAPTAPPVEIDDARFTAAFHVWSEDPAFARALLDQDLRDWLGSLDPRWGVEVHGRIAMVYGPRPDRPDVVSILEALKDFVGRVPKDVLAAHPPPFEDGRTPS
jgi:hypothetical protein